MRAKEMIELLESHGYSLKRQEGSHVILKNPIYESVIIIPDHGKELPAFMISSIKRNVVEKGVMTSNEFANALAQRGFYQFS